MHVTHCTDYRSEASRKKHLLVLIYAPDVVGSCFSYTTVLKRWPIILTSVIDNIYRFNHDLDASIPSLESGSEDLKLIEERISEGKAIIEKISKLKYEMARDRALESVFVSAICYHWLHLSILDQFPTTGKLWWQNTIQSSLV